MVCFRYVTVNIQYKFANNYNNIIIKWPGLRITTDGIVTNNKF